MNVNRFSSRRSRNAVLQQQVPGTDNWLVRIGAARRDAALKLFCFPFAGGSALDFREWARNCPDAIELYAIQLPGRGARFQEQPLAHMDQVLGPLIRAIIPQLDRPFVLFGHSLGGRLAFAVAREQKRLGAASSAAACRLGRPAARPANGLQRLICRMRRFTCTFRCWAEPLPMCWPIMN